MDNPFDVLRKLQERLTNEAADLGLELHQMVAIPNPDPNGPDMIQAAFIIRPEAVEEEEEVDPEQERIDAEFEAILKGEQKAKEAEKIESIKDDVAKWLEGS